MTALPRIVRAVPHGPITRPEVGIPVIVVIRWHDGRDAELPATAMAWTRSAVEITWDAPGIGLRSDWVPAEDVFRSGTEARMRQQGPPSSAGMQRQRW